EDIERMRRAQEGLTKASHKLAEIMYREAQSGQQGGPKQEGPAGGPKEGEGVDAEFEDLGDKKEAMRRHYYAGLRPAPPAAPREVRQAYQRLARQYSPDVNFWDERARGLFEEIREAYRVLSDPHTRAHYDQFGAMAPGDALGAGRRGDDLHVSME